MGSGTHGILRRRANLPQSSMVYVLPAIRQVLHDRPPPGEGP
jgi:hypothetical protein